GLHRERARRQVADREPPGCARCRTSHRGCGDIARGARRADHVVVCDRMTPQQGATSESPAAPFPRARHSRRLRAIDVRPGRSGATVVATSYRHRDFWVRRLLALADAVALMLA